MERLPLRRKQIQELGPDKRRPTPDKDDDSIDESDVDSEEDRRWQEWENDETGTVKVPLPPEQPQPEIGIYAPTPEMDDEDHRRQKDFERRRQQERNNATNPNNSWEAQ